MYKIILILLFTCTQISQAAELCGRVSFKERGANAKVILADLQSEAEPVYFEIANPGVRDWQIGSCVCARGYLTCANTNKPCSFEIRSVTSVDLSGHDCLPTWFP